MNATATHTAGAPGTLDLDRERKLFEGELTGHWNIETRVNSNGAIEYVDDDTTLAFLGWLAARRAARRAPDQATGAPAPVCADVKPWRERMAHYVSADRAIPAIKEAADAEIAELRAAFAQQAAPAQPATDHATGAARTAAERYADILRIQHEEAVTGDAYMRGLYNGMLMMCANFDNTEYEPMPAPSPSAPQVQEGAPADSAAKRFRTEIADVVQTFGLAPLDRGMAALAIAELIDNALATPVAGEAPAAASTPSAPADLGWFEGAEDCDGNPLVRVTVEELHAAAEFMIHVGVTARRINGVMVKRSELAAKFATQPAASSGIGVVAPAEPIAWMDPSAGCAMDAFLWQKDAANPQYHVPVYTAPADAPQQASQDNRLLRALKDLLRDCQAQVFDGDAAHDAQVLIDEVEELDAPQQANRVPK